MNPAQKMETTAYSRLNFVVETLTIDQGLPLKSAERDKDGYFIGQPLAVLGTVTRNNTHYDIESIVNQITNPNTPFNMRLTEGNLIGENGHPLVDFNTAVGKARMMTLDPNYEACFYRKIYSKKLVNSDRIAIFGDVKPSGPFGPQFEDRMIDPTRNCAFSLRSITMDSVDPKTRVTFKRVLQLVTFDVNVPSGGYKEASKRFALGGANASAESVYINNPMELIDIINGNNSTGFGCESIIDDELLNLFKANKITIERKTTHIVDRESDMLCEVNSNRKRGIFSTFIKMK